MDLSICGAELKRYFNILINKQAKEKLELKSDRHTFVLITTLSPG